MFGDWTISVVGVIVNSINPAWYMSARVADGVAALPSQGGSDGATERRLAGFLTDVSGAWALALPEDRNRIARELFDKVQIEERVAVVVRPRPELLPFFGLICLEGKTVIAATGEPGAASDCQNPVDFAQRRKRRGSNPRSQP